MADDRAPAPPAPRPAAARARLPVVEEPPAKPARPRGGAGGWAAFTDGGAAPRWVVAARVVMLVAFAATIPVILGVRHGNRLVWTVAIASLPFFWMAFGYHLWRRICPLAVIAQLGRLAGRPGTRRMGEWMGRRYVLVQLGLMLVALSLRLVATNGSDAWLAGFLGAVAVAAAVVGFVYGGKTWCNFLCPVGLVEKIHTEPVRAALTRGEPTSQCSPCVACKKHCPDIDLEQGYWKEAGDPPRRLAYYAWPGVVVGFYAYYALVSGGWDYYFSGRWTYERDQPARWLDPGFTFLPAIPRVVAAPLTLIAFGAASLALGAAAERLIAARRRRRLPPDASAEQRAAVDQRVRHVLLAVAGWAAFNAFYLFAGQPSLRALPGWVATGWGVVVVAASTAMLLRRAGRTEDAYVQEKFAQKLLKKWEWGDAPPSDNLKDIYLVHTERTRQREARLRAYKETIRELVADGLVTAGELAILDSLRAQLGVSDRDHAKILGELSAEERQLFDPTYRGSVEQRLARAAYRKDLERLVVEAARLGAAPPAATLAQLRAERGVGASEAEAELAAVLAPDGPVAAMYAAELAAAARHAAAAEACTTDGGHADQDSASLSLLRHLARRRGREHVARALGLLAVVTGRPEVELVRAAAAGPVALGPAALAPLGGIEPALRAPLEAVVARLAADDAAPLASPAIVAVAQDASRHVRAAAAILLSRFDDDEARAALLAAVADGAPLVREAAVRALGARRRLTRELLTQVLADPDPRVRHAAVRAVSGGASASDLPAMTPALTASAIDPARFAQTRAGVGNAGAYATLDANAAMAQLTLIERIMLLRQVPIFEQLDADELEDLAAIVEEHRIEAGRDLCREGDEGDAVFVIVRGAVRVFTGGDGRPERTLSTLGPGACIGEMAVLDAAPRSATVRATEVTRALRVPGAQFKHVLQDRPEMGHAILTELVRRMRRLMAQAGAAPPPADGAAGDRPR